MSDSITTPTEGQGNSDPSPSTPISSPNTPGSLLGNPGRSGDPTPTHATSSGWTNDAGEFNPGWIDKLGADFESSKATLARFKSLPDVLKTLTSQQKMLGSKANAVVVPSDDATPEEKAEFYSKLGRPETADSYLTKPKDLPEGFQWDEAKAKEINKLAHEIGVLPHQMEKIIGEYAKMEIARADAEAQKAKSDFDAAKKTLSDAWGDKYATNEATATRMAKTLGLDINTSGLKDPNVVMALERAAGLVSEDRLVPLDSVATTMPGKARAHAIMTDESNPLFAAYHGKKGFAEQKKAGDLVMDLLKHG